MDSSDDQKEVEEKPTTQESNNNEDKKEVHEMALEKSSEFAKLAQVFFLRFGKGDIRKIEPLEEENVELTANGIAEDAVMARNFLCWRRGLLWVAGVSLAISAILSLIDLIKLPKGYPGYIIFVLVMFLVAKVGASYFAVLSALRWAKVNKTKKLAKRAWACMYLLPVAVCLIPATWFITTPSYGAAAASMGLQMGLMYLAVILPLIVGVFPGLIRSSLTLKTMLPQATMPGWVAVIVAPLYAMFFLLALVVATQAQGFLTTIGLLALSLAPLMIVKHAKTVVSPVSVDELEDTIGSVRTKMKILNLIGIAALVIYVLSEIKQIGFLDIVSILASIFASIMLVTAVCSDLLLGMFKAAFASENELREGELVGELETELGSLDNLGLTKIRSE